MTKDKKIVTSFNFQGKLTKISYKKKKIKYIKLATDEGKYWLKVPKKLREKIASLPRGCQLEVAGRAKQHAITGKTKYKVKTVVLKPQDSSATPVKTKTVSLLPVFDSKTKSKAKVLICQKSNCWKKGGKQVCAELESVLSDRGLTKEIPIKKTGCLKQCKKAPALVMMPDKARYSKVKPKQVKQLVEQHLIADN
ncbi:(2Fe-2S) ferredoxin domain-containing protein [Pleurocapsales cyanobacterium LEGE 10410]|nr:(2Fe-2S) ferredoxin domain-containing protein [Pleurocapsales cyanobacterium LEGE 10410]